MNRFFYFHCMFLWGVFNGSFASEAACLGERENLPASEALDQIKIAHYIVLRMLQKRPIYWNGRSRSADDFLGCCLGRVERDYVSFGSSEKNTQRLSRNDYQKIEFLVQRDLFARCYYLVEPEYNHKQWVIEYSNGFRVDYMSEDDRKELKHKGLSDDSTKFEIELDQRLSGDEVNEETVIDRQMLGLQQRSFMTRLAANVWHSKNFYSGRKKDTKKLFSQASSSLIVIDGGNYVLRSLWNDSNQLGQIEEEWKNSQHARTYSQSSLKKYVTNLFSKTT